MLKLITPLSFILMTAMPACAHAPASESAVKTSAPSVQQTVKLAQLSPQPKTIAPTKMSQKQRYSAWKDDFTTRAIAKGHDPALVASVISSAKMNPKAIARNKTQPEFSKPIWSYVDGAASAIRVNSGKAKLRTHTTLFDDIETRFHVDRNVLTAVWGLETAYGKILGNHDIIDSLSTFAFEGRRKAFGESQLFAILDMLRDNVIRIDQLTGSWAGAMGMTQFIPTTFRDYAVDYRADGNKDLWTDPADALGSAANYLSRFGWRIEEPIFTEVILPKGFAYELADGTKRTISGWSGMGVRPVSGQTWSNPAMFLEAKLLIPAGANGPVFLTFKNFDVIKKYNNSTSYALGIGVLAKSYQGETAIVRDWPRTDKPLSHTDKKNLQRALTNQGFDTKGVDGQLGPNSRRAIRAWQTANKVPADGYVEQSLLKNILGK
ncbi:MAG: murein transglycosylase [Robiginitomaculum sp.]|nr:MAG: murein transglycosylase [Robiginitomaculum sp.]